MSAQETLQLFEYVMVRKLVEKRGKMVEKNQLSKDHIMLWLKEDMPTVMILLSAYHMFLYCIQCYKKLEYESVCLYYRSVHKTKQAIVLATAGI
jgi:hypothetical protein